MLDVRAVMRFAVTIAIAGTVGLFCQWIGLPVPFLLGSLFGVWIAGGLLPRLRPHLGVARGVHIVVVTGLGVLIGAMFTPAVLDNMGRWSITVGAMLGATVFATGAGFLFLTRVRRYPANLALLCCLPGGQAEIVAVSRDLVEKDYVVALCHLVRVASVFCLTPLLLTLAYGDAAVQASNAVLESLPGIAGLSIKQIVVFLLVSCIGFYGARLLRIPMPHLLGPLVLSALLHVSGLISVPRISELVLVAQIVIGGTIGARLAQVAARELAGYLRDALANAAIVVTTYISLALLLSFFLSAPAGDLMLAFVPGGLYEVTLLALIFGFDVAFVTFHHTIRVLLIFFALPVLMSGVSRRERRNNRT